MKINRKIKIVLSSILGIFLLLFAILVYHIASMKPVDNATIQISRIDFDKPFDSVSTVAIQNTMRSIPGVKNEVIVKRNVVVYFHDNRVADSKKVFSQLMAKGNFNAKRFVLPPGMAGKEVCPVMKPGTFKYAFTKEVQRIFN